MPVPVLTGVGHEVDRSVADEVAHTACKTPTACAQILVTQVARVRASTSTRPPSGWVARARSRAALAARELDDAARRIHRGAPAALAPRALALDHRHGRVQELGRLRTRDAEVVLAGARALRDRAPPRITCAARRPGSTAPRPRSARSTRGVCSSAATASRAPANGRIVRRAVDASVGDELVTELASGRIASRVEAVEARRGGEPVSDDAVGYADAMAELGDILDELERDDLDVDVLAERVKRAERADQALPYPDRACAGRRRQDRHRSRVVRHRGSRRRRPRWLKPTVRRRRPGARRTGVV